jgi:Anti-sigma-K factor rskA
LRDGTGLSSRRSRAGWFVAAACFLLAVAGWWPRLIALASSENGGSIGQFSADWSREHMLDVGGEAVRRWPWSPTGSAPGVTGDVVWDNNQQMGFLTFAGLEANSPLRHQYQLWIVDSARDERYPVDGGVFDVPAAAGPVVIPVRATVPVREPLAFVVTVEKPGGAVVSGRERVVAVARPAVN